MRLVIGILALSVLALAGHMSPVGKDMLFLCEFLLFDLEFHKYICTWNYICLIGPYKNI